MKTTDETASAQQHNTTTLVINDNTAGMQIMHADVK
jgi:hypothetical protein